MQGIAWRLATVTAAVLIKDLCSVFGHPFFHCLEWRIHPIREMPAFDVQEKGRSAAPLCFLLTPLRSLMHTAGAHVPTSGGRLLFIHLVCCSLKTDRAVESHLQQNNTQVYPEKDVKVPLHCHPFSFCTETTTAAVHRVGIAVMRCCGGRKNEGPSMHTAWR